MQPQFPPPPPPPPPQPLLPPGWERALDSSSGRYYYANRSTGETSWDPPLPPPPPPPPRFSVPPPPPMHQNQGIAHTQHQSLPYDIQHPLTANPAYPPPNIPVGHNTIPVQAPQFPPPQTMMHIQNQSNNIHPELSTLPTKGKVGYQFDASTATTPGLLVPSVRSMIKNEMSKNRAPKLELEGLTAGAIADLCNVTSEFRAKTTNIDKGDFADETQPPVTMEDVNQYYMPLEPFTLPAASRPPHIEAGRVDIRLHALYSKLNRI